MTATKVIAQLSGAKLLDAAKMQAANFHYDNVSMLIAVATGEVVGGTMINEVITALRSEEEGPVDAKLLQAARRIQSPANRQTVVHLITVGMVNARDTIFVEQAAPASDWNRLVTGTIGTELAHNTYDKHVVKWFAKNGVTF